MLLTLILMIDCVLLIGCYRCDYVVYSGPLSQLADCRHQLWNVGLLGSQISAANNQSVSSKRYLTLVAFAGLYRGQIRTR